MSLSLTFCLWGEGGEVWTMVKRVSRGRDTDENNRDCLVWLVKAYD